MFPLKWRVVLDSDGAYQIICISGDTALGIRNPGRLVSGIKSATVQTWTIEPRGNSFVIGSATDKTAIHLTERNRVVAFDRNNNFNQRWIFDPNPMIGATNPTTPAGLGVTVKPSPIYTYTSAVEAVATSGNGWRYCIAVNMPSSTTGLQLESLDFVIKYANRSMTTHGTHQVDIILTPDTLPIGITPESTALSVYRTGGGNYRPFILDRSKADYLHRRYGVKYDHEGPNWRHEVISDSLVFLRTIPSGHRIYLLFHVFEYNTGQTARYLTVDATAMWSTI